MALTRRKFLKHMAVVVSAGVIAPAALAKSAAQPPLSPDGNDLYLLFPDSHVAVDMGNSGVRLLRMYEDTIIIDQRRKRRKNPLFTGKMGFYDGFTLHRHK